MDSGFLLILKKWMGFMNRRQLIKSIGKAICAGCVPPFLPNVLPEYPFTWGNSGSVIYFTSSEDAVKGSTTILYTAFDDVEKFPDTPKRNHVKEMADRITPLLRHE